MISSEITTIQDSTASPQDPSSPPHFASKPVTRVKSQRTPNGEIQNMTHEEVQYTPKELFKFSNLYQQTSREHGWILRVWDNMKEA